MNGSSNAIADYQADLLEKLAAVERQLEVLHANKYLLMQEAARLKYMLRGSGWRPPARADA